ncbi:HEPN domain-containing protein [Nannocystis pusilla]|uniref:HEPN domain-containing protein n=1 Tax=Nannocystis pusilla TaxID=889268 RepID=UPI003DA688D4
MAHENLAGARLLAAANNRNAIYLCEQAVEKVIKAVLTSEGIHVGIKHELDVLVDKLPDENPIKVPLRDLEYLAAYAASYRYPTEDGRASAARGRRPLRGRPRPSRRSRPSLAAHPLTPASLDTRRARVLP